MKKYHKKKKLMQKKTHYQNKFRIMMLSPIQIYRLLQLDMNN
jgi:hypothetical protein